MSQEGVSLLIQIRDSLASIDASLHELVRQKRAEAPKTVASDRDLDGKYGNPKVTFMPRDWTGAPFKGRRFSECPADLLELVANTLDWFGEEAERKNEKTNAGKPVAPYKRQDAARARGWAKRIRDGRHVQTTETTAPAGGWADDEAGADDKTAGWA